MQQDGRLGERMLEILLCGVSTRKYETVIPELAETVSVSKSSLGREFIEASAEELKRLNERRFDDVDLLCIYIDGMVFGSQHVVAAVGVDVEGDKHVLGVQQGASENATVVKRITGVFGGTGRQARPATSVCDRRVEGSAGGQRPGLRHETGQLWVES